MISLFYDVITIAQRLLLVDTWHPLKNLSQWLMKLISAWNCGILSGAWTSAATTHHKKILQKDMKNLRSFVAMSSLTATIMRPRLSKNGLLGDHLLSMTRQAAVTTTTAVNRIFGDHQHHGPIKWTIYVYKGSPKVLSGPLYTYVVHFIGLSKLLCKARWVHSATRHILGTVERKTRDGETKREKEGNAFLFLLSILLIFIG